MTLCNKNDLSYGNYAEGQTSKWTAGVMPSETGQIQ